MPRVCLALFPHHRWRLGWPLVICVLGHRHFPLTRQSDAPTQVLTRGIILTHQRNPFWGPQFWFWTVLQKICKTQISEKSSSTRRVGELRLTTPVVSEELVL